MLDGNICKLDRRIILISTATHWNAQNEDTLYKLKDMAGNISETIAQESRHWDKPEAAMRKRFQPSRGTASKRGFCEKLYGPA